MDSLVVLFFMGFIIKLLHVFLVSAMQKAYSGKLTSCLHVIHTFLR